MGGPKAIGALDYGIVCWSNWASLIVLLGVATVLSACAETGREPNPPLQLAKSEFTCTMNKTLEGQTIRNVAPFQFTVTIIDAGRRAEVEHNGRMFRVRYSGQGATFLPATTFRVNYAGRDIGERVRLSVPNRARSGRGTFAEFNGNSISRFTLGTCE